MSHHTTDEVWAPCSAGVNELDEVNFLFHPSHLHHGMDGDEGTDTTYTTGEEEGEGHVNVTVPGIMGICCLLSHNCHGAITSLYP